MTKAFMLVLLLMAGAAHGEDSQVWGYPLKNKLYLSLKGSVDPKMHTDFQDAVTKLGAAAEEIFVDLDSPGGSVDSGMKIVAGMRALKAAGKKLITTVRNGNICASMCVPLYLQGAVRRAGPASSFMFHSAHMNFLGLMAFGPSATLNETALFEVMEQAGVDREWTRRMKAEGIFDSPQAYWLNGRELAEEKSGIVTELLPRLDPQPSLEIGGFKIWF